MLKILKVKKFQNGTPLPWAAKIKIRFSEADFS